RLAEKARTEARRRGSPLFGGFAALLEAAVHRRLRRADAALAAAQAAQAAFEAAGETNFLPAARRERALALGALGPGAEADAAPAGLPEDADTLLARARLRLAGGAREAAVRDASAAAAALSAAGRKGELWRAYAVAARAGDPAASALARKGFEEILMKTPD